jgi:hypothetical protein
MIRLTTKKHQQCLHITNVTLRTVIGHDWLLRFTNVAFIRNARRRGCAQAHIVGNQHAGRTGALCIAHLFDKGAVAAINHQNKWRCKGRVVEALRVAAVRIDMVVVAKGIVGIVDLLLNRAAVGWDAKQGVAMIVAVIFAQ